MINFGDVTEEEEKNIIQIGQKVLTKQDINF